MELNGTPDGSEQLSAEMGLLTAEGHRKYGPMGISG